MKVLFSRHQNDFEHVYELESPPRKEEEVGLLKKPTDSAADWFIVERVMWTPDHTAYDVSVSLRPMFNV